jgi:hypothetical protein
VLAMNLANALVALSQLAIADGPAPDPWPERAATG